MKVLRSCLQSPSIGRIPELQTWDWCCWLYTFQVMTWHSFLDNHVMKKVNTLVLVFHLDVLHLQCQVQVVTHNLPGTMWLLVERRIVHVTGNSMQSLRIILSHIPSYGWDSFEGGSHTYLCCIAELPLRAVLLHVTVRSKCVTEYTWLSSVLSMNANFQQISTTNITN